MAEARSAVAEPRVLELEEGKHAAQDFLRAWRKAFFRRFFRTRQVLSHMIIDGLWMGGGGSNLQLFSTRTSVTIPSQPQPSPLASYPTLMMIDVV